MEKELVWPLGTLCWACCSSLEWSLSRSTGLWAWRGGKTGSQYPLTCRKLETPVGLQNCVLAGSQRARVQQVPLWPAGTRRGCRGPTNIESCRGKRGHNVSRSTCVTVCKLSHGKLQPHKIKCVWEETSHAGTGESQPRMVRVPLDSPFSLEAPLLRNVQGELSQGHSSSPSTALMILVSPFQPSILYNSIIS